MHKTFILALLICSVRLGAQEWNTFSSGAEHFTIQYPASWFFVVAAGKPSITVYNFRLGEIKGTPPLPEHGAQITISSRPNNRDAARNWIQEDLQDSKSVERQEIERRATWPSGTCSKLTEIKWTWDTGREIQEAAFFCESRSAIFRIKLTTWRDDTENAQFEAIALRVAQSLKVQ